MDLKKTIDNTERAIHAKETGFQVQQKLLENFVSMAQSSVDEEMLKASLQKTLDVSYLKKS